MGVVEAGTGSRAGDDMNCALLVIVEVGVEKHEESRWEKASFLFASPWSSLYPCQRTRRAFDVLIGLGLCSKANVCMCVYVCDRKMKRVTRWANEEERGTGTLRPRESALCSTRAHPESAWY